MAACDSPFKAWRALKGGMQPLVALNLNKGIALKPVQRSIIKLINVRYSTYQLLLQVGNLMQTHGTNIYTQLYCSYAL